MQLYLLGRSSGIQLGVLQVMALGRSWVGLSDYLCFPQEWVLAMELSLLHLLWGKASGPWLPQAEERAVPLEAL